MAKKIEVKGGPPPPILHCFNCSKRLTGKPEHCMDENSNLFCDETCKEAFRIEMLARAKPSA